MGREPAPDPIRGRAPRSGRVRGEFGRFRQRRPGKTAPGNALLNRPVAVDRHPVHQPVRAAVVGDGVVLGAAVVPEGDGVFAPVEAAGEFRRLVSRSSPTDQSGVGDSSEFRGENEFSALLPKLPTEIIGLLLSKCPTMRFVAGTYFHESHARKTWENLIKFLPKALNKT